MEFREGRVVSARAERGDAYLQATLDTDDGARFLGELGIGTNFGIDRPIGAILFDEKIGGTVHLAVGKSYPETGGTNESVVHWDMICDLRQGGSLSADGEVILRDGAFVASAGAARTAERAPFLAPARARRCAPCAACSSRCACCSPAAAAAPRAPPDDVALRKVDDFPLYELTDSRPTPSVYARTDTTGFACTVFFGAGGEPIMGRNFDFHDQPALLLRHRPPGAYASISMVDISYLGFDRANLHDAMRATAGAARAPHGCRSTA